MADPAQTRTEVVADSCQKQLRERRFAFSRQAAEILPRLPFARTSFDRFD
jgi:hypothetical protein